MPEQTQTQDHTQRFELQARGEVLEVPVSKLDALLDEMLLEPEAFLEAIARTRSHGDGASHYSSLLFALAGDLDRRRAPLTLTRRSGTPTTALADLDNPQLTLAPDVSYVVTNADEVRTIAADHLRPRSTGGVDRLPRELRDLYLRMVHQKNWMTTASIEMYEVIGEHQSRFIRTLEPTTLEPFAKTGVQEFGRLPHHASTYYRLARGRSVDIRGVRDVRLPVEMLLPNEDEIRRYHWIAKLNLLLVRETEIGTALSDQALSETISPRIARRTVAKLRDDYGIPDAGTRTRAYRDGRGPFPMQSALANLLSPCGVGRTS